MAEPTARNYDTILAPVITEKATLLSEQNKVVFRVAGGTGGHAGATGHGRFHITSNLTPCNGQTVPAHVWFEGVIKR